MGFQQPKPTNQAGTIRPFPLSFQHFFRVVTFIRLNTVTTDSFILCTVKFNFHASPPHISWNHSSTPLEDLSKYNTTHTHTCTGVCRPPCSITVHTLLMKLRNTRLVVVGVSYYTGHCTLTPQYMGVTKDHDIRYKIGGAHQYQMLHTVFTYICTQLHPNSRNGDLLHLPPPPLPNTHSVSKCNMYTATSPSPLLYHTLDSLSNFP